MKMKKMLVFTITLVFLFGTLSNAGVAELVQNPSVPTVGDTMIYKVTTWDVPDILNIATQGNVTSDINLLNSEIAFKILKVETDGYYWGAYVKAGQGPIKVTVKSDAVGEEASDIFASFLTGAGDLVISLPADTAFPLVMEKFSYFDPDVSEGFPLWLKNVDWAQVQSDFNADPERSYSEDTSAGTVTLGFSSNSSEGMVDFFFTFQKSTDTIFKSFQVKGNFTDDNGQSHDFNVVVSYSETKNLPLPTGFDVGDEYVYKYNEANLDIQYTLNQEAKDFINSMLQQSGSGVNNIDAAVQQLETVVTNVKDTTAYKYTINEINGVYYTAEVSQGTSAFPYTTEVNGFNMFGSGGFGPVMTPDWAVWDGLVILGNTAANVYVTVFDVDTAGPSLKTNYTNMGIVSGPQLAVKLESSSSNGIKYHTAVFHSEGKFDSSQMNKDALGIDPATEIPPMVISSKTDVSAGVAHTDSGYFLSAGVKVKLFYDFDITLTQEIKDEITSSNPNLTPPDKIVGSVTVDLKFQISLDSSSSGVSQDVLNKVGDAQQNVFPAFINAGGVQSSPGFEFPLLLIGLFAVAISVRKVKKIQK